MFGTLNIEQQKLNFYNSIGVDTTSILEPLLKKDKKIFGKQPHVNFSYIDKEEKKQIHSYTLEFQDRIIVHHTNSSFNTEREKQYIKSQIIVKEINRINQRQTLLFKKYKELQKFKDLSTKLDWEKKHISQQRDEYFNLMNLWRERSQFNEDRLNQFGQSIIQDLITQRHTTQQLSLRLRNVQQQNSELKEKVFKLQDFGRELKYENLQLKAKFANLQRMFFQFKSEK